MNILKNLITTFTELIETNRKAENKPVMVIVNNDNDYGLYVQKLVRIFRKYNMKIRSLEALKAIKTNDVIVVGDGYLFESGDEFDVRVEKFPYKVFEDSRYDIGERDLKFYDVVEDFKVIEKELKENYRIEEPTVTSTRKEVLQAVAQQGVDYMEHSNFLTLLDELENTTTVIVNEEVPVCEPEIVIHDNVVKIDYNFYKVYIDVLGNKFIVVNGTKYYILRDRYGKKYLKRQ